MKKPIKIMEKRTKRQLLETISSWEAAFDKLHREYIKYQMSSMEERQAIKDRYEKDSDCRVKDLHEKRLEKKYDELWIENNRHKKMIDILILKQYEKFNPARLNATDFSKRMSEANHKSAA